MSAVEGTTGIPKFLVTGVFWITVNAVAIPRIVDVADHVDTGNQLASKIRVIGQNASIDHRDGDVWATRRQIPCCGQLDLRVVPLLGIQRIIWRSQWRPPIVGFCALNVWSARQGLDGPNRLLFSPLALGHTGILAGVESLIDLVYRSTSCLNTIEGH